jgi:hypothetical protein
MMVTMEIALVICLVAAVAALTWLIARRNPPGRPAGRCARRVTDLGRCHQ